MPRGRKQPVEERFWLYVNKCQGGCWEWTGKSCSTGGYGLITSGGKQILLHRLSYELHHPLTNPIDDIKLYVLHSCDNRKCVNPSHLSLGTSQDNMNDMVERGRSTIGEKNPQAKLTEQQVIEIRTRHAGIRGQHTQLATEYGVTDRTISDIINRRSWAHLPPHSSS